MRATCHSLPGRLLSALRRCVTADDWACVCSDVRALAVAWRDLRFYHWMLRDTKQRLPSVVSHVHPKLAQLVYMLEQAKALRHITAMDQMLGEDSVRVEHSVANDRPPQEDLAKLVQDVWGTCNPIFRYVHQPRLVHGVRLSYQHETYDVSFSAYRHNLVFRMRSRLRLEHGDLGRVD